MNKILGIILTITLLISCKNSEKTETENSSDSGIELTQTELKYKSGPISGKIEIERIKEIIKGKSLWSGLKPATARNGLIIKYDKYEEIYISPKTNDSFVEKILEYNSKIKITTE